MREIKITNYSILKHSCTPVRYFKKNSILKIMIDELIPQLLQSIYVLYTATADVTG